MSEQQCFQDVAGRIIDVDAKRSQLLLWVDSFANVFGKSFAFDKYYLFLASLLADSQQVAYAKYDKKHGEINLLVFFEDSLIEFYLRDSAFASPPFIERGLSPFFADALKKKVLEVIKIYKAKAKNARKFLYVPSAEEGVPVPPEFEDRLAEFTPSKLNFSLRFSSNMQFILKEKSFGLYSNELKIYTPFLQTFGTEIKIYIKKIDLDSPISANIPVTIQQGLKECGVIYINVLELAAGSIKLSEQCHIITKQDEPIANQTLCEALNKLADYTEYALDIIKKLTLKGATTLTTLLLY